MEVGRGADLEGRGEGAGEGERKLLLLPVDLLLPRVSTMCSSASDVSES